MPGFLNITNPSRYGWLGTYRRSVDAMAGLVLMGVRLYNPVTGRFLQVDPVIGGSANSYDYANQEPVGNYDLQGKYVSNRYHWEHNIGKVTLNVKWEGKYDKNKRWVITWYSYSKTARPGSSGVKFNTWQENKAYYSW